MHSNACQTNCSLELNLSEDNLNQITNLRALQKVQSQQNNMAATNIYMNNSPVSAFPSGNMNLPQMAMQNQFIDPSFLAGGLNLSPTQMPMGFNPGCNISPCPSPVPSPSPAPGVFMNNLNTIPMAQGIGFAAPQQSMQNMALNQFQGQQFVAPQGGVTYVDMYGNTMVPVLVGSYSPPAVLVSPPRQMAPQQQQPQMNSIPMPMAASTPQIFQSSPSVSYTQSVSPDLFVYHNQSEPCTRSRHGSMEARSRRSSVSSARSFNSATSENKKELVPRVLRELQMTFMERFTQTGLRGTDVFRIKCKTKPSLKNILSLLQTLDSHVPLMEVSCPASTKKGKRQKRGFLCYVKVDELQMPIIKQLFDEFNDNRGSPFNAIEINPQRKQPKVEQQN